MATNKELKALITLAGKVDPTLQAALLKSQKLTTDTTAKLSKLQTVGTKALKLTGKAAKIAAAGLAALAISGAVGLVALGKQGLETASNLAEVQNVVDVTFGKSSADVNAWSQTTLNAYGLAELSAKSYSSTMGAMLKSSGVADDQILTMSKDMTQLAGDMASFYNLDSQTAFDKIRSGISGETEPLKQLGINMSVANMQAYALSQGINKSYGSMSQAEQMTLHYNYLLSVTADAQGDFARTSGSLANQQKLLKENFSQLSAKIMTGAIPALSAGAQKLNTMLASMDTGSLSKFVAQIAQLGVDLMPIAMDLMPVIQNLMESILPPLLELIKIVLPPITRFLNLVIKVISKIISIGVGVFKALFSGGENASINEADKTLSLNLGKTYFATGGFASRPSIFGEAGLEAAIPIKRGNQRSLSLLQRTAQLLGVSNRYYGGSNFTYAPVIQGGNPEQIEPILRKHYDKLKCLWESMQDRRRRLSFA